MEQKLECDTVRDLLPTYIEKMTSNVTNRSIEEHVKNCEGCRAFLKQMNQELEVETVPEVQNFKKYLNKSKAKFAFLIIEVLSFLAVFTCAIVNLAVEHRLSWSLIVDGGIVMFLLLLYTGYFSKNHRIIKTIVIADISVFMLLGLIQVVLYNIMGIGDVWFWSVGFPIAVLWSIVVWLGIACNIMLKTNVIISISIILFLSIPANILTNIFAGSYTKIDEYNFIANGLGNLMGGVVFLVLGVIFHSKKKVGKKLSLNKIK